MGDWYGISANKGDDIAVIFHSVCDNVIEPKPGDRAAAFHGIGKERVNYAEYAIPWGFTTFHLPNKPGLEVPLLIYGAPVSSFAIELARLSNIHPTIAVAGRGEKFVRALIDRSKESYDR
ncbi:MAG: hypothetical protein M1836_006065 [Candelina mexicana]|nr:MAG: hypothetical protein M1836_006065 [Candelina mexicana]